MDAGINRRAVVLFAAIVISAFLVGYFVVPTLLVRGEDTGVKVLEASLSSSNVKAGEATLLVVKVSNTKNDYVDFKVLITIQGDVERYVTVEGYNVEKLREGVWQWSFGELPPYSEVRYTTKLSFNIPSGIAQIKYRVQVDFLADGSTIDGKELIVEVSS